MSGEPAWKKRPGKCPSRCDRGTLLDQCKRTCDKEINHGAGGRPGGKLHDCGKH